MYYVYLIKSIIFPNQIYIGYTLDLEKRLKTHNISGSVHTSMYKPWKLIVSFEFNNKDCAIDFEKYLEKRLDKDEIAKIEQQVKFEKNILTSVKKKIIKFKNNEN